MLHASRIARLVLTMWLIVGVIGAPLPAAASAATPTVTTFQVNTAAGAAATCTLTVNAPVYEKDPTYGWGVWAKASVTCSATVSSIRIVVELRKKDASGNTSTCNNYDSTKTNVKTYSTKVGCPYSPGWKWQSGASGYPPNTYKQNPSGSWLSL